MTNLVGRSDVSRRAKVPSCIIQIGPLRGRPMIIHKAPCDRILRNEKCLAPGATTDLPAGNTLQKTGRRLRCDHHGVVPSPDLTHWPAFVECPFQAELGRHINRFRACDVVGWQAVAAGAVEPERCGKRCQRMRRQSPFEKRDISWLRHAESFDRPDRKAQSLVASPATFLRSTAISGGRRPYHVSPSSITAASRYTSLLIRSGTLSAAPLIGAPPKL